MKTIGEKLRSARDSQGRSLDDIAAATRINRKFLDEIERGIVPNLPATYVRAFVKSYAGVVGIDPAELLQDLDPGFGAQNKLSAAQTPEQLAPGRETSSMEQGSGKLKGHQLWVLFMITVVMVLGLIISIIWLRQENTSGPVKEISFSDVIKEQESKTKTRSAMPDSLNPKLVSSQLYPDSLLLEGIASDSVRVKITADDKITYDRILPPLYRTRFKAQNSLLVSVGNLNRISFTLNGYKLGNLGTLQKSPKGISITRETLSKLQNREVKKP